MNIKKDSISLDDIEKNLFSLAAISYKHETIENDRIVKLNDLLDDRVKGSEPGSNQYLVNSNYNFIRISDVNDYDYTFDLSDKVQKVAKQKETFPKVKKGDILYQTASNVGNVCIYVGDTPSYYNSHLIKLTFKRNTEYIFAFLKSSIAKKQLRIAGSIKGVDNFRKEYLEEMKIIFPSYNNSENPENIIDYVECLVKNLLDKEECIKLKDSEIDNIFIDEINNNNKNTKYISKLPSIKEILGEGRIDTPIYVDEYKEVIHKINDYEKGIYYLEKENIFPGYTPKDHIYSDIKEENNYLWITPKNLEKRRLLYKTYIRTSKRTRVEKNDIIFSGIRYLGNCIFIDTDEKIYANQNTLIVRQSSDIVEQLFILCYFSSLLGKNLKMKRRVMGTVPILYADEFIKIPIPKFDYNIKQKIAEIYYNNEIKENDYTLDNYLEKEKLRNRKLGIHQLNTEIDEIKIQLEDIMKKIVNNSKIDIFL